MGPACVRPLTAWRQKASESDPGALTAASCASLTRNEGDGCHARGSAPALQQQRVAVAAKAQQPQSKQRSAIQGHASRALTAQCLLHERFTFGAQLVSLHSNRHLDAVRGHLRLHAVEIEKCAQHWRGPHDGLPGGLEAGHVDGAAEIPMNRFEEGALLRCTQMKQEHGFLKAADERHLHTGRWQIRLPWRRLTTQRRL
eukprot:4541863-Prymnesium_polylepis.1